MGMVLRRPPLVRKVGASLSVAASWHEAARPAAQSDTAKWSRAK
jgi:hypothetical protein